MSICIPKEISQKLLKAVKSGEFTLQGLTEMKSSQRNEIFNKYTDPKMAQSINAMFEKAIISSNKKALAGWVEKTLAPGGVKTPKYKNTMKKINDLNDAQLLKPELSDNFMGDIVAESLGISVSAEEAQVISEKASKLEKLSTQMNPKFPNEPIDDYYVARADLLDYLKSVEPSSNLRVFTSTIARGTMLASFKSPLLNIISNIPQTTLESGIRRIAYGQLFGYNTSNAKQWARHAISVFKKSGIDLTRTIHLDDRFTLGEDMVSSEGKGIVRKVGRFYEDTVFKWGMSMPDVIASAFNFADNVDIFSSRIARKEGLTGAERKARALEIFQDATRVDPQTDEGKLVREQSISAAMYATFQNDSIFSKFAMSIRTMLNSSTGDIRLGDQLMPFVKTPANVVKVGLDFAGLGSIEAIVRLPKAIKEAKKGEMEEMQKVIRGAVRSGIGFTLAVILASAFDPDDYIGAFPTSTKEQELLRLKRATPNSIKIGNKYVSLDYFGAIGSAFVGIMHARKYGDGIADTIYQYFRGSASQFAKIPGIEEARDVFDFVSNINVVQTGTAQDKAKRIVGEASVFVTDEISARLIPSIVFDIGKALDDVERKYDPKNPIQRMQAKLPILREMLDTRTDVFGYPVQTEGPISTLLFGSRVKSAQQDYVTEEMSRLNETGNLPSLTDIEKTSSRVKDFKTQVDIDTYNEMVLDFKISFSDSIANVVDSDKYWNADDEKKASIINGIKSKILDKKLKQYGYYKPD